MFDGWLPSRVAGRVDELTMHWQYLPVLVWCDVSSSMVQWLRKLPWNQRAVTRAPVSATISPAAVCLSYSLNSSLINTFFNKAPWKSPNISRWLCFLAHRRYKYKIAVNLFFSSFFMSFLVVTDSLLNPPPSRPRPKETLRHPPGGTQGATQGRSKG